MWNGNDAAIVADLRRRLRMTQEEFAHAIGVTVSTVNRWENGHIRPSRLARRAMERLAASLEAGSSGEEAGSARGPQRLSASPAFD